jgi:hypothetical protein
MLLLVHTSAHIRIYVFLNEKNYEPYVKRNSNRNNETIGKLLASFLTFYVRYRYIYVWTFNVNESTNTFKCGVYERKINNIASEHGKLFSFQTALVSYINTLIYLFIHFIFRRRRRFCWCCCYCKLVFFSSSFFFIHFVHT